MRIRGSKASYGRQGQPGSSPQDAAWMCKVLKQLVFLIALCGPLAACEADIEITNAPPKVTWLAAEPEADGVVELTVWISDFEGDSVDLTVGYVSGEEVVDITLAGKDKGGAGHGLSGLTTHEARQDPNGQSHLIRWDVAGVPSPVTLVFGGTDREAESRAQTVESESFDLSVGIPEPTRLTPR